jgi:hypothetical protein
MYLCNVCSCQEILRRHGRGQHLLGARQVLLTEQPTVASLLQRAVDSHFGGAAAAGRLGAAALDWEEVVGRGSYDRAFPAWCRGWGGGGGNGAAHQCADEQGQGGDLEEPTGNGGGGGGGGWDVILCSDCVYEPLYGQSWRLLSAALRKLCSGRGGEGTGSGGHVVALCAVERRRADGVPGFLAAVRSGSRY